MYTFQLLVPTTKISTLAIQHLDMSVDRFGPSFGAGSAAIALRSGDTIQVFLSEQLTGIETFVASFDLLSEEGEAIPSFHWTEGFGEPTTFAAWRVRFTLPDPGMDPTGFTPEITVLNMGQWDTPPTSAMPMSFLPVGVPSQTDYVIGLVDFGAGLQAAKMLVSNFGTSSGTNSGTNTGANPTADIGLTPVNGVATTFMRSDAAPELSQSIEPTWTGLHNFSQAATTDAINVRTSGTATSNTHHVGSPRVNFLASIWNGSSADLLGTFITTEGVSGSNSTYATVITASGNRFELRNTGEVILGDQTEYATSNAHAVVYIPECNGTPSGTPVAVAGMVALKFDRAANKLWVYNGSWKSSTFA